MEKEEPGNRDLPPTQLPWIIQLLSTTHMIHKVILSGPQGEYLVYEKVKLYGFR